MAGYLVTSGERPDVTEIFPGTLDGLIEAICRAQEVSAACSPREVIRDGRVIRRYEDGKWIAGGTCDG